MSVPSLRELFEQLVRNPSSDAQVLDEFDLDGPLMAEAVTNAVAGFPPEVAEHFSEYTAAASPVPTEGTGDVDLTTALDLFTTAPEWPAADDVDSEPDDASEGLEEFGAGAEVEPGADVHDLELDVDELDELPTVADDVELPDPLDELDPAPEAGLAGIEDSDPAELDEIDDNGTDGDVFDG